MAIQKSKTLDAFRQEKFENDVNKENKELKNFYETLSAAEKRFFRIEVISQCQISEDIFFNWMSRTRIHPLAKPVIERIAGKQIFLQDKAIPSNDVNQ